LSGAGCECPAGKATIIMEAIKHVVNVDCFADPCTRR
jgi:hypothetical protein